MSKVFILVILSLFLLLFEKNLQAQEPVPVVNPGPIINTEPTEPQAAPATDSNNPPPEPVTNSGPTTTQPTTNTPLTNAGGPSISAIGDLSVGEQKSIEISGLNNKQKYVWKESKLTNVFLNQFRNPYTEILSNCFISDDAGKIQNNIGPYLRPGIYRLTISTATSVPDECKPSGNPISSQEFSVGGETGTECCPSMFPFYDTGRDTCNKDAVNIPSLPLGLPSGPTTIPTQCKAAGNYCEPDSLKCFKTKSLVVNSKICVNPDDPKYDPNFDKNKYAICPLAGGKVIIGCSADPNNPHPGIATAIGCIHTSPVEFTKDLMTFLIGISGGLAFLMMLLGAFQMLTSAGNPDTLAAGKSRLTSAVIGLLIVIFATLLLQIIGFDILKIPGFGR
ncbi:hypothetical protein A2964_00400 [Candidatus Daviesbacteria bacterium RIFCSPLOWO2_01_FULL_40_27]|nr:MAG: hypothetical protein A2964_00400 [Candidatus Daviesbacteria bacterium RIFCSPLOWO2_01_FULL_40_27]